MPTIGQDNDKTFTIKHDNGSESQPIAKGADPSIDFLYQGLLKANKDSEMDDPQAASMSATNLAGDYNAAKAMEPKQQGQQGGAQQPSAAPVDGSDNSFGVMAANQNPAPIAQPNSFGVMQAQQNPMGYQAPAPTPWQAYSEGGEVPGKARVAGNSPKNDTVNAKVSPGELIIPRATVAKGPEAIAAFAKEALAGKHNAPAKGKHDEGGLLGNSGLNTAAMPVEESVNPNPFQGTPSQVSMPMQGSLNGPSPDMTPASMDQGAALANSLTSGAYMPQGATQAPPMPATGGAAPNADAAEAAAVPETPHAPQQQGAPGFDPYKQVQSSTDTVQNTSRTGYQAKAQDDFKNSIDANTQAQIDGATAQAKLAEQRANAEAITIGENNKQMAAFDQQRNAEINARLEQIKNVQNKFLGMSIDSNRMFGDKGTGSKLMAGIGLMLGAFGQGLSGKESPVPAMLERAIDRDIDVQKANIQKAGHDVDMLSGGLKDYLGTTNDMKTAMVAEKARQLELVGKQMDAIAAANSSPMIKAAASQASMAFKEKYVGLVNQVGSNVTSHVVQSALPQLGQQDSAQVTKAQENIATQAKTEHLMQMIKDKVYDPGFVKGHFDELKAKYGLASPTVADFVQTMAQVRDKLITDTASARGFSDAVSGKLRSLGGSVAQNKDELMSQLQNIHDTASKENGLIADTNAQNRRYPLNLQSMRSSYDQSTPTHYGVLIPSLKPMGGKKK